MLLNIGSYFNSHVQWTCLVVSLDVAIAIAIASQCLSIVSHAYNNIFILCYYNCYLPVADVSKHTLKVHPNHTNSHYALGKLRREL